MYTAQKFGLREFVFWTRRDVYRSLAWAAVPAVLYHTLGFTFLAISWVPVASLGTAVSLLIGFKSNVSYSRLWEARQIYGGIAASSRSFAVLIRDLLAATNPAVVSVLFAQHFAWLTALRYQLREPREWENMRSAANHEYSRQYLVPEQEMPLAQVLATYLPAEHIAHLSGKQNQAVQLMAEQSRCVNGLATVLSDHQMSDLRAAIASFYTYQSRAEGIKSFPYPPNFASITSVLLYLFVLLIPFGLLSEFGRPGRGVWLTSCAICTSVFFATLLMWVFVALDRAGESSTNPFEGSANDVPISSISRAIEIDMREMLSEVSIPAPLTAVNHVLL